MIFYKWKNEFYDEAPLISVNNASVMYGVNVFEGLRAYFNKNQNTYTVLGLHQHIERMYQSAEALQLPINVEVAEVERHLFSLIEYSNLKQDAYIRITLLPDNTISWSSIVDTSLLFSIQASRSSLRDSAHNDDGITAALVDVQRIHFSSMPPEVKCGANYVNSRYAMLDAHKKGADFPIFCDINGYLSESGGANIFFRKKNNIYTPSKDCSILSGITREILISKFKENGHSVYEAKMLGDDILNADEVFLVGTSVEVLPIKRIGERTYNHENRFMAEMARRLLIECIVDKI